jgi:hypothetical protein
MPDHARTDKTSEARTRWLVGGAVQCAEPVASRKALQQNAYLTSAFRTLASALAHTGCIEEARDAAHSVLLLEPNFALSEWNLRNLWRKEAKHPFVEGLRIARLPKG